MDSNNCPRRFRQMNENYFGTTEVGNYYFRRSDGKEVHDRVLTTTDNAFKDQVKTWDYNHGRGPYGRNGHNGSFTSFRYSKPFGLAASRASIIGPTVSHSAVPGGKLGESWRRVYRGGFANPSEPVSSTGWQGAFDVLNLIPNGSALDPDDLSSDGSRAYKLMRPKLERASLGQTIVESRDIPRMLKTTARGFLDIFKGLGGDMRSKTLSPKGVAEQFLNFQFGWKPFIKDLNDSYDVIQNFSEYSAQVQKRNNTWIKRSRSEQETLSETLLYSGSPTNLPCSPVLTGSNPSNDWIRNGSIRFTIKRQEIVKKWYTGQFKYYRPEFDKMGARDFSAFQTARQYATLLGANISPSLVWKVTPWTWMADWFFNVGDNIQAFEDHISDSIVSRSVYSMRHITVRWEYRITASTQDGQTLELIWYRSQESKRRGYSASPFGFSLNSTPLSGVQYAILGALGLTRLAP